MQIASKLVFIILVAMICPDTWRSPKMTSKAAKTTP